jgi:hypothetical protein
MRSEQIKLSRPGRRFLRPTVGKHGSSLKGGEDLMFVCERGIKIRKRITIFFDGAGQAVQATESIHLLHVSQACCFQRPAQAGNRSPKLGHAIGQPGRDTSAMKR